MKAVQRSIFSMLPQETKDRLLASGEQKRKAKGELIFGEREDVEDIYFLLDGYVSLFRSSFQGETRVIFICAAGEILNEVVVDSKKTSVAARALSDVVLLRVPRERLCSLMEGDPTLVKVLFHSISQKTRRLYHKVGNANGTYALKNRLAATLWKLARDYGVETEDGCRIAFEITVNFLSSMMGAKRESVSRALSEMKRNGLISHENGSLILLDMQRLREAISE